MRMTTSILDIDSRVQALRWRPARSSAFIAAGLVALAACSGAPEPTALHRGMPDAGGVAPTVLVHNPFCDGTSCEAMDVYALVLSWPIPQPRGGIRHLGRITSASGCFALGPHWTLAVHTVRSDGTPTGDSTVYEWDPDDTPGIRLSATTGGRSIFAQTHDFLPGTAAGWDLQFADDPPQPAPYMVASLASAEPCTP